MLATKIISFAYASGLLLQQLLLLNIFQSAQSSQHHRGSLDPLLQQQSSDGHRIHKHGPFKRTRDHMAPGQKYLKLFACEGDTVNIVCQKESHINLIRANFGRFSIDICNDDGNINMKVNCMSKSSFRVVEKSCERKQYCSMNATVENFDDGCPGNSKYLEVHYRCVPDYAARRNSSVQVKSTPSTLTTPTRKIFNDDDREDTGGDTFAGSSSSSSASSSSNPAAAATTDQYGNRLAGHNNPSSHHYHNNREPSSSWPSHKPPNSHMTSTTTTTKSTTTTTITTISPFSRPNTPPQMPSTNVDSDSKNSLDNSPWSTSDQDESLKPWRPAIGSSSSSDKNSNNNNKEYMDEFDDNQSSHKGDDESSKSPNNVNPHYSHPHPAKSDNFDGNSREMYSNADLSSMCSPALYRGLFWNYTRPGHIVRQRCPPKTEGMAEWRCSDEFGQVMWLKPEPDLSGCRSIWVTQMVSHVRSSRSNLLALTQKLVSSTKSEMLFGGDIQPIVEMITDLLQRMRVDLDKLPSDKQNQFVKEILTPIQEICSNLLEDQHKDAWSDLRPSDRSRSASTLVSELEQIATEYLSGVREASNLIQTEDNLYVSLHSLPMDRVSDEGIQLPIWDSTSSPSDTGASRSLASRTNIHIDGRSYLQLTHDNMLKIGTIIYSKMDMLLDPEDDVTRDFETNYLATIVNSDVVSLITGRSSDRWFHHGHYGYRQFIHSVHSGGGGNFRDGSFILSPPSQSALHAQPPPPRRIMSRITFKHLLLHNVSNARCAYWSEGRWSTHPTSSLNGCQLIQTNQTHTVCECDHVNTFAILMDITGDEQTISTTSILLYHNIAQIGCMISSIFLGLSLATFLLFKNLRTDRTCIHTNLCLCLLVVQMIFIFGIDQTNSGLICTVIGCILHYFLLATFMWMLIEALHLYLMLVEIFEPDSSRLPLYFVLSYGLPLVDIVLTIVFAFDAYGTGNGKFGPLVCCWLADKIALWSFIVPVIIVLISNFICLIIAQCTICRTMSSPFLHKQVKHQDKIKRIRSWVRGSFAVLCGLTLCWSFGVCYLFMPNLMIAYSFALSNILLALLIFTYQCICNSCVRNEYGRFFGQARWLTWCTCGHRSIRNCGRVKGSSSHHASTAITMPCGPMIPEDRTAVGLFMPPPTTPQVTQYPYYATYKGSTLGLGDYDDAQLEAGQPMIGPNTGSPLGPAIRKATSLGTGPQRFGGTTQRENTPSYCDADNEEEEDDDDEDVDDNRMDRNKEGLPSESQSLMENSTDNHYGYPQHPRHRYHPYGASGATSATLRSDARNQLSGPDHLYECIPEDAYGMSMSSGLPNAYHQQLNILKSQVPNNGSGGSMRTTKIYQQQSSLNNMDRSPSPAICSDIQKSHPTNIHILNGSSEQLPAIIRDNTRSMLSFGTGSRVNQSSGHQSATVSNKASLGSPRTSRRPMCVANSNTGGRPKNIYAKISGAHIVSSAIKSNDL
ncbi:latrophilin Cirl-like isoform X2 [Brevipalpus obovatus]|uniref:latrophilin Cirl-like isoform X2 n=2 Tax=Brevipalpus obovatus TaxID=246614 RepID=UPI003D9F3D84